MSSRAFARIAAFAPALAACTAGGDAAEADPERVRCPLGDLTRAPELEILFQDAAGILHTAAAGDRVPLLVPPQGGHVLYVGARARNLDCVVHLTTSLTDVCDPVVATLEGRAVTLVPVDGWGEPEFPNEQFNVGNLPACPVAGLPRAVVDEPWVLTVKVEDHDGRAAEGHVMIVPECPADDPGCRCECRHRAVLGEGCDGPDAGPPDAASACPSGADAATD